MVVGVVGFNLISKRKKKRDNLRKGGGLKREE